jgi:4-amino-4-deoxy-L-arabinose transferase-like glycosyltransferase
MRNKHWIFALFVSWMACCPLATAQDIGLPASFDRDADIMSPGAFWGFEIGEYHPRHDQIVAYFEYLAETSDRVSLEVSGYSH